MLKDKFRVRLQNRALRLETKEAVLRQALNQLDQQTQARTTITLRDLLQSLRMDLRLTLMQREKVLISRLLNRFAPPTP